MIIELDSSLNLDHFDGKYAINWINNSDKPKVVNNKYKKLDNENEHKWISMIGKVVFLIWYLCFQVHWDCKQKCQNF